MSNSSDAPEAPPEALMSRSAVHNVASVAPRSRVPIVGEQFDKYTLLAKLATGGMAELFVAKLSGAAGFSKNVVIKRILPHVAHDEHFTRMFLDEALTCAQINHPNVCQVFELCETNGTHFLVLEYLEGATVGELIRRCLVSEQQLNMRLAVGIIVQACDGLHAAHEQVDEDGHNSNLVHRDVSPGNLFVTVDGIVKVLDFGIAKARWMSRKTKTGTLLGKCEYMSPEQARGGVPLDRRSDVFCLGIVAWELVCGQRLFRRESEYETLRAVLRAPIEKPSKLRPSVPRALDEAIMQALERDPCDRFQTAHDFRQAMAQALRDVGGPTPMCDIAPLIRTSFAEDLKVQRAILRRASQIAETDGPPRRSLNVASPASRHGGVSTNTGVQTSEVPCLASEATKFRAGSAAAAVSPAAPEARGIGRDQRSIVLPLALTLLLGAAVTTAVLIRFTKAPTKRPVATQVLVPQAATTAPLGGKTSSRPALANDAGLARIARPTSAVANAAAQAELLERNQNASAVVMALPDRRADVAPTGTIEIQSSLDGEVFLYPTRERLGRTPLTTVLPTGRHKLRLRVGPKKGQTRYFHIVVEPDIKTRRSFDHW